MSEQSSLQAAVDPDRLVVKEFEQGGAQATREVVSLVSSDDVLNATFAIRNEDHTLGNALRNIIMTNPDVDFCGYSIPHPSEAKIHMRIQSRRAPAIEVLRKGLDDLQELLEGTLTKFEQSVAKDSYLKTPDTFV